MPPDRKPAHSLTLKVNGQRYGGWTGIRLVRSIEEVSSEFEVSLSERYPNRPPARDLRDGDAVVVLIGKDPVITGFIDEVEGDQDENGIQVTIRGRDRTADLVDCAPDLEPSQWSGITLEALARKVAAPFGVEVVSDIDAGDAFSKVVLNPGEKAWALLEERARYRSVLLTTDGAGRLVLTRAGLGGRAEALKQGVNLRGTRWRYSQRDRFSDYIVRGQSQGTDFLSGSAAAGPEGRARDLGVKRHRPFLRVVQSALDGARATKRAQWEATVRAARAGAIEVTQPGWRQGNGAIWRANTVTRVDSDGAGVHSDMIVSAVAYTLTAEEESTTLQLVRPDAYTEGPEEVAALDLGFQL